MNFESNSLIINRLHQAGFSTLRSAEYPDDIRVLKEDHGYVVEAILYTPIHTMTICKARGNGEEIFAAISELYEIMRTA